MKKKFLSALLAFILLSHHALADEYEDAISKLPVLAPSSFPKMPESFGHYEKMALDLAFRQEIRAYFLCTGSSTCSKEVGIFINRRDLGISPGALTAVVRNRFALCNDLDAFTEFRGTTDDCKKYVYQGFKQWIEYSKDKSVSRAAWEYGESQSGSGARPLMAGDAWNFNAWDGFIRVAQSHGM
ncbi:hypothetical protein [Pantoea ananatis]|uniref:hypothetical protein n=1 Tax=Pantoea ananas TaxID=553 RepID=UPI000D5CA98C|nr:hypothetical protein [Pantoea ananatis]PVY86605.1 hypothetical protein C7427_10257 [Pantoea ananatis]